MSAISFADSKRYFTVVLYHGTGKYIVFFNDDICQIICILVNGSINIVRAEIIPASLMFVFR